MAIKKGYKQTDIGIIPEDWEVESIINVANVVGGGTPSTSNSLFWNGDINWFTPTEVGSKKYLHESKRKITQLGLKNSSAKILPSETLLLTSRAGIGDIGILKNPSATNQGFQSLLPKDNINGEFLYYLASTLKQTLLQFASGSTFLEITPSKIKSIQIPIPPTITEQTAIATALSDMDALITALDKKIAKKKAIKQGAMQQLLKPQKGWQVKKLEDICSFLHGSGLSKSHISLSGKYKCLLYGELFTAYTEAIREVISKTDSSEGIESQCGDILFPGSTTTTGIDLAKASTILLDNVKLGGDVIILRKKKYNYNPEYAAYFLNVIKRLDIAQNTKGITIHHLHGNDLKDIEIHFPTIEKQIAIAQILSDMDNEIAALEAKRDKYRELKSGMMQQLLTGQIRLVNIASQVQKLSENRTISIAAHIVGGHIVNKLYNSKGWGRTKLQKSMHLVGYCCQLDFGNEYVRNIAGPDDQLLMDYIDSKFKQYGHVTIEIKRDSRGGKHYNYVPTCKIVEIEQAFDSYPTEIQENINNLMNKIKKMDLARAEIVSTLYAVWNNRIIKKQSINDDLLLEDFYDWSAHKSDFRQDLVLRGLNYMRQDGIIPIGWGKYIDKSKA